MNTTTFLRVSTGVRNGLALAACGGAFLFSLPAHAQYDQFVGPVGPVIAVPQIVVQRAGLSSEQRAQLLSHRDDTDPLQARQSPSSREAPIDRPRRQRLQEMQRNANATGG